MHRKLFALALYKYLMPVFWQKDTLTFQAYALQEGCEKRRFALLAQEVNSMRKLLFPCSLWDTKTPSSKLPFRLTLGAAPLPSPA